MAESVKNPMLNEHNYAEWSFYVKQQLVLKGWDSAVDPSHSIPGDLIRNLKDSVAHVPSPAPEEEEEEAGTSAGAAAKARERETAVVIAVINERALALIRGTVSFNCSHLIGGDNVTAMEAWLNLESACAAKLKGRIAALKNEIQNVKLGKRSVGEFVGYVVRLGSQV